MCTLRRAPKYYEVDAEQIEKYGRRRTRRFSAPPEGGLIYFMQVHTAGHRCNPRAEQRGARAEQRRARLCFLCLLATTAYNTALAASKNVSSQSIFDVLRAINTPRTLLATSTREIFVCGRYRTFCPRGGAGAKQPGNPPKGVRMSEEGRRPRSGFKPLCVSLNKLYPWSLSNLF